MQPILNTLHVEPHWHAPGRRLHGLVGLLPVGVRGGLEPELAAAACEGLAAHVARHDRTHLSGPTELDEESRLMRNCLQMKPSIVN